MLPDPKAVLRAASFVTAIALAACAANPPPEAPPPRSPTGLRGVAVLASNCSPAEAAADAACVDAPFQARIAVEIAGTTTRVYQGMTDARGRFEVPLAPGNYRVIASTPQPALTPRASPLEVNVPDEGYADVTVPFDGSLR